ncbi:peptidoglycan DD-metalloendopeptidase family protein [Desulfurispora thermophila]|uniref:peptidoglycan DD-metalloendopeptidase family protein n=1 Tax=Desulfurispora thermophila TaxID=265470 RepID=UPI000380AF01|nr:M23 family metallopeptidase [Desulfurispora thermophila]
MSEKSMTNLSHLAGAVPAAGKPALLVKLPPRLALAQAKSKWKKTALSIVFSLILATTWPVSPCAGSLEERLCAPGEAEAIWWFYQVQPGETLSELAVRFDLPLESLLSINDLSDPDFLPAGQLLKIPAGEVPYRVMPGDTLWSVARRFQVDVHDLARYNDLASADFLPAGQLLYIPASCLDGGQSRYTPTGSRGTQRLDIALSWPVEGWVSSPFGLRQGRPHEGIDIAADFGEPIRAAAAGRVVFAGPRGTYGLTVIIDHGDGWQTLYAHASQLLVSEGQEVAAGETVALVGSTGRSTGPHLHLEVRKNGMPVNPARYLPGADGYA